MVTNYEELIQVIETNIPDNTEQLITAEKVRDTLEDMVDLERDINNSQNTYLYLVTDLINYNYGKVNALSEFVELQITETPRDGYYYNENCELVADPNWEAWEIDLTRYANRTFWYEVHYKNNETAYNFIKNEEGEIVYSYAMTGGGTSHRIQYHSEFIYSSIYNKLYLSNRKAYGDAIFKTYGDVKYIPRVIDNLNSDSSVDALSANQGNALKDMVDAKADKVSNATNGNFAGLDASGNLTDSGYNTLSFPNVLRVSDITQLTSEQCESLHIGDIVVTGTVSYLVTTLDNTDIDLSYSDSDTITTVIYSRDSTSEPWQYIDTTRYSLSTKPNKPSPFTSGHLAALDSQANLTDSGKAVSDFATAAQGALADTAYQKPLTGIPASDLADGVIPLPEIFVAIVNRTTYQEITDALADDKVLIAVEGNKTYYYAGLSANNDYMFFSILEQSYSYVGVDSSDLWFMAASSNLEFTYNKVTSISSSSIDTQYPSAKCVYDTLLDYVQKSQTVGLLKNDGTVDTNTYLTQQDIVNKADKTSVVTLAGTSVTQELADNTIYQCSELSSLTITVPSGITSDYISQINFESGSTATTLTAPNTIIWFGDDLTNNVFVPAIGKQYVVIFYYDGTNVRSIVQSE